MHFKHLSIVSEISLLFLFNGCCVIGFSSSTSSSIISTALSVYSIIKSSSLPLIILCSSGLFKLVWFGSLNQWLEYMDKSIYFLNSSNFLWFYFFFNIFGVVSIDGIDQW